MSNHKRGKQQVQQVVW